jgi:antitoxin HicB
MPSMKKLVLHYPAIFDVAEEGGYNVYFPNFPGCATFGRTFEEAREKAKEVLELWLMELAAEKEKIPVYHQRPIIDEISINVPAKTKVNYAPHYC